MLSAAEFVRAQLKRLHTGLEKSLADLPPVAQGTGMSTEEAHALRIKDLPLFQEYLQKVWAGTEELFVGATPSLFEKMVTVKPLGEMSVIQCLGQVGLIHGMTHLGEIELARTLVGAGTVSGA